MRGFSRTLARFSTPRRISRPALDLFPIELWTQVTAGKWSIPFCLNGPWEVIHFSVRSLAGSSSMNWSSLRPVLAVLMLALPGPWLLRAQADASSAGRVRTVLTAELPPNMNGTNLRATLITVQYGPGEASPPHTHACPVIVYVAEGAVRSAIKGQPQLIYHAGESFYEPPGRLHLISANASNSAPARFVAFFVCDRDVPLSSDSPNAHPGGTR